MNRVALWAAAAVAAGAVALLVWGVVAVMAVPYHPIQVDAPLQQWQRDRAAAGSERVTVIRL